MKDKIKKQIEDIEDYFDVTKGKEIKGGVLAKKFNRLFIHYLEKNRIIGWSHVKINELISVIPLLPSINPLTSIV